METKLLKTRTILYLAILYGFLLVGWLLAVLLPESYNQTAYLALWGSFSLLLLTPQIIILVGFAFIFISPLVLPGFNYGSDYWGAPLSGILMMILVCVILGTWLAYVTTQTASDVLRIRLEAKHAGSEAETWDKVEIRAREYLQKQGLGNVSILRAPEPPMRDPKSGKFRNVWAEKG
jgi:hypothetical protein